MIPCTNLSSELRARLKKMAPGDVLRVRTWKGDRGLTVTCTGADRFRLEEDGFQSQRLEDLNAQALLKAAKPVARREFPRSNRLRLYTEKDASIDG